MYGRIGKKVDEDRRSEGGVVRQEPPKTEKKTCTESVDQGNPSRQTILQE